MTAVSAPLALDSPVDKVPAPKKGGIDYSKFENIEDSDDEKPKESASVAAKPAEKPHCHNCHKDISKPLRCGVCKKVEYCSAQCQKEDWLFHKRVCKKPAPPKAKAEERKPPAPSGEERETKRKEEEKVVETDENLTWYRHREWKPEEGKKEFKPTQITADAQAESEATSKPAAGSAWNKAGTWEDKDVTDYAQKTLKERLQEVSASVDVGGGSVSCEGVDAVDGDASKPVIRGKQRHMFDLSFKAKFVFKWMESSGQRKAKGHVEVTDFTNDTFTEGVLSAPNLRLSFTDAGLLEAARRRAVEGALGAGGWPPEAGTLMHDVAAKMQQWAKEYQEAS